MNNQELLYKIAKLMPKPIRKLIKLFYNPIIPTTEKMKYGEDSYPEATELMCKKLKEIIDKKIEGDIIEFGTYKGGTTLRLAKTLKQLNSSKIIYSLDTFEGLKGMDTPKDKVPKFYKSSMKSNINKVNELFFKNKIDNVELLEGLFNESIPKLKEKRFCFAYVDCDLYEGTKQALEFLIPRMNKKGIIFIDDYYSKSFIGVKKAVLEILFEREIIQDLRVYWIK